MEPSGGGTKFCSRRGRLTYSKMKGIHGIHRHTGPTPVLLLLREQERSGHRRRDLLDYVRNWTLVYMDKSLL